MGIVPCAKRIVTQIELCNQTNDTHNTHTQWSIIRGRFQSAIYLVTLREDGVRTWIKFGPTANKNKIHTMRQLNRIVFDHITVCGFEGFSVLNKRLSFVLKSEMMLLYVEFSKPMNILCCSNRKS